MKTDRQSPISEYLLKLQLIVSNCTFKNKNEANKYETVKITDNADVYIYAVTKTDIFENYTYNGDEICEFLMNKGYKPDKAVMMTHNHNLIPPAYKEELKIIQRERYIKEYVEENKYYQNLTGRPYISKVSSDNNDVVVCIPDEFYDRYKNDPEIIYEMPIHEMPTRYQELFMNSEFYATTLQKYPSAEYLKYIGSNSISIPVSRRARDGDILKINTNKLSTYHKVYGIVTVTPDIVHKFTQVYNETRNYVFNTLYGDFGSIYPNYDEVMRFLTIYMTIGNCMNEFMKNSTTLLHMNNAAANNLFSLYGLPSVIMEGHSMIEFLKKFRLLLMDKGTNSVYRVKDLVGYEYTDIYSLIMVKQQVFKDGKPMYVYDEETGEAIPQQNIVFRRFNTDNSTTYFDYKSSDVTFEREEITSGDPRWWDGKDVEEALQNMNYTLSNSKYIQLSTHLSLTDIWWQTVILMRGLLDNRLETEFTSINVNFNVNGSSDLSVFETVLCLLVIMNWELHLPGNMYIDNDPYDNRFACLDELSGGMYQGQEYTYGKIFKAGDIVGVNTGDVKGSMQYDPEHPWLLYRVMKDFMVYDDTHMEISKILEQDIKNGNIKEINPREEFDNLMPKDLKLGNPYKIASFDFDLRKTKPNFYKSLGNYDYLNPSVFVPMVDKILDRESVNIGETLMIDIRLLHKYLEDKLRLADSIEEYRQVTEVYNNLFLVDPIRNWTDEIASDIEELIKKEYEISTLEYSALANFFSPNSPDGDFKVPFKNKEYRIWLYAILNTNVMELQIEGEYMFKQTGFYQEFCEALSKYHSKAIESSIDFSDNLKANYKNIIEDKVTFEVNDSDAGPKTFEALLHRTNPSLYKYVSSLRTADNKDAIILFLRSLIKALETYTNSSLAALEFKALGVENYINILKEVISYFKSYMVEFTKDEFVYMFDGLWDYGGSSNMLKLIDEITHMTLVVRPADSLTLFDVGKFDTHIRREDGNKEGFLRDEAIFRLKQPYSQALASGYDIWYDDGKNITKNPFSDLTPDTEIIGNLVKPPNQVAYKFIIHKNNVNPDNYYGNKRKMN